MSVEQDAECRPVVGLTAGVDWASADHAVAVVDRTGVVRDRFVVAHRAADLSRLTARSLDKRNGLTLQGMHAMAELRTPTHWTRWNAVLRSSRRTSRGCLLPRYSTPAQRVAGRGDTGRAETLLRNAADRYAELGDVDYYARALRLLATCRLLADDATGASKLYREAMRCPCRPATSWALWRRWTASRWPTRSAATYGRSAWWQRPQRRFRPEPVPGRTHSTPWWQNAS
jgi:hypothetical protein